MIGSGVDRLDDDTLAGRLQRAVVPFDTPISALPIGGFCAEHTERPLPAAVLLAVIADRQAPAVLLTRRSKQLRKHPGQIALPGGRAEAGDGSVLATALRETEEETGIPAAAISPLGYLGRFDTITGYRITAVVGLVEPIHPWTPDRSEIEEIFTVPLAQVADPTCYRRQTLARGGRCFELLILEHPIHHIWGATASMLYEFGQRIC